MAKKNLSPPFGLSRSICESEKYNNTHMYDQQLNTGTQIKNTGRVVHTRLLLTRNFGNYCKLDYKKNHKKIILMYFKKTGDMLTCVVMAWMEKAPACIPLFRKEHQVLIKPFYQQNKRPFSWPFQQQHRW